MAFTKSVFITLLIVLQTIAENHDKDYVPHFIRSAVESIPEKDLTDETFARFSIKPTFGDVFLPLRSAIESVPLQNVNLRSSPLMSKRNFLRDSVEQKPADYETDNQLDESLNIKLKSDILEEDEPIMYKSNAEKYAAFIIPTKYDPYSPQPFRYGSPYQQIVDGAQEKLQESDEKMELRSTLKIRDEKDYNDMPKVLCYFTNWAFYRMGEGKFVPEHIESDLCTAVIYSFASLEPESLMIREFDPWVDVENDLYKRTIHALNVPVLLAMGGWTDSSGDKYSRLISNPNSRKMFASNLVTFLKRHGFKGVHLDWNYPKCWQSDCRKGPASDKPNFTKLIQDIRAEFNRVDSSMQLGVAISGYKEVITEAYELSNLANSADYLTVMSYDYHGAWESETGHVSPLYGRPGDKYPQYNTDYTMNLLVKLGAPKEKLIMGIPFYGQSFTLKDVHRLVGDGAAAVGPGEPGEYTKQPGMMAYYEICNRVRKNKWQVGRDSDRKSGPYAMLRNQWIGYEDPSSVESKARYASNAGYGGVAAWTIDLDDFQNRCCGETFPLLKAINRALGRISTPPPNGSNCQRPVEPVTPIAPVMTTVGENGLPIVNHEHTTWPTWNPSATSAKPSTDKPTTAKPTTAKPTTTKPTTSKPSWWQPESSTQTSTWWPKPSTTTTSRPTTQRTTPKTTQRTTTERPTQRTTSERPTQQTTTTAASSTSIPAASVVQPVIIHDGSHCVTGEFKGNPLNCNTYFQCIYEELKQQYCPGGLHWNEREKSCDWPDRANCQEISLDRTTNAPIMSTTMRTTKNTRTTTQNIRTTTKKKPSTTSPRPTVSKRTTISSTRRTTARPTLASLTKCETGIYYPHKDCDSFYICVNNRMIPQQCGPGLQWNIKENSCDWSENVRCVSKRTYLRLIQARTALDDPCEGSMFLPFPGDCTQYLRCNWNRLESDSCPPGLHWNQNQQICDWPASAKCTESNNSEANSEAPILPPGDNSLITSTRRPGYAPTIAPTTAKPEISTRRPDLQPLSGYYKVVCYFTNWAWYRKGIGRYTPDDIDTDLCTHIVYGFAVLDYTELTIRTHDSWADIDNKFYDRVAKLKEKGVKVSLALGGWNDSQGDKYSRLVRNPASRAKFVKQAVQFIEKYGFEGLDLDWEYPVCWQTECNKGFPDEKEGFTELVRELSMEFKPRNLLLSTAVSPSKKIIDAGYNVPELSRYFDWIAVMTYDFHGQWDKKTGHVAPLYHHPQDDYDYFNSNFSIHYWIEKGAPSRKIVMGMPLYGQSFTISDAKNTGLNSHAPGPGQAGEFTRAAGFLAYYEICDRIKTRGWNVVQDEMGRMGPYAYKGNQWVSFDDKATLLKKSQLVRALNLGGGMIWALDLDDFKNHCGEGAHPLLTTIRNALREPPNGQEPLPKPNPPMHCQHNCEEDKVEVAPESQEVPEIIPDDIETLDINQNEIGSNMDAEIIEAGPSTTIGDDFKVVCYFTNWAWYRQGGGKYVPEDIDANLCTHVVYGFAVLDRDNLIMKPHDSWADIDNKFYDRVVAFKAKGIKVTVAIGGWNDSAGDKYSRLVRSAAARARFVKQVTEFIEKYGFDGLDLDWEYPVCWQVDCNKGYADEREGFADLVKELSDVFKPKGLLLSSAVSPNKKVIDAGYDVPKLSKYFDWIAVMTYDYHGQWDKKTGHVAPMYETPDDDPTFNANFTINYWLDSGADRKKIIMGMPMYGQSFSLAEASRNTLNSPTYGGGEAGEATRARGFLSYYEICENIRRKGWKVVRDRRGRIGPYAHLRDQWVSFDDILMIRHKSEYVKAMDLGGAMIWALDLDDFKNNCDCEPYPLLKTINRVLRNYPGPQPKCKLEEKSDLAPDDMKKIDDQKKTTTSKPSNWGQTTSLSTWWPLPSATSTTTNRPQVVDEKDAVDLSCKGKNFAPHYNDCNKFYLCQFGLFKEQRCPEGLHWNEDHCDWPHNSNCISNELPPSDDPTTRKPPQQPNPTVASTMRPMTTQMTPKPSRPTFPPANRDEKYKVVCYFTNWAWYRPGDGKYTPNDIDENLCTHVVYGFAVLNRETLTIKTHDSWADIDNRFYARVVELRNKGIRVTLAIGGWNDSLGDKYSRLVLDPAARARFVRHVTDFIEKYGFEGLDLDWEYPVCWQTDCKLGKPAEKEGFVALVRELSEEFKPKGLLLSAAVSPSKTIIDAGYDVPALSKYFDWIAVMTYDFHGHWDKATGHVAPLYYMPGDKYDYFNGNFSIRYWIESGAPPEKIIMGMPLYGQSFRIADGAKERELNTKSVGPGEAGKYTRAAGFLAYYEICEKINSGGYTVIRDPEGRIGPYAYKGSQWFSYDDVADIRRKSDFIKKMRLGGGMVWALDLDDFRGRCGCGKHPLLRTLSQELRNLPGQRATDCT